MKLFEKDPNYSSTVTYLQNLLGCYLMLLNERIVAVSSDVEKVHILNGKKLLIREILEAVQTGRAAAEIPSLTPKQWAFVYDSFSKPATALAICNRYISTQNLLTVGSRTIAKQKIMDVIIPKVLEYADLGKTYNEIMTTHTDTQEQQELGEI